jgi:hypothetical protein
MGGRTYSTKTIMVDGSRIDVRQVAFKGDQQVPTRVAEVVRQARRWLLVAVEKTNASGFTRDIKAGKLLGKFDPAIFRHFFLQEPTPGVLTTVWRNLAMINAGLSMSFGIKIRTMGARGSVNPYYPMFVRSTATFGQRKIGLCSINAGWLDDKDKWGDQLHSKGEIHIDVNWLFDENAPRTLIHEGGHKFANLWDVAYYDPTARAYKKVIDAAGAMRNADTYAFFAKTIALVADQRAAKRTAADSDETLDLSSLFG